MMPLVVCKLEFVIVLTSRFFSIFFDFPVPVNISAFVFIFRSDNKAGKDYESKDHKSGDNSSEGLQ